MIKEDESSLNVLAEKSEKVVTVIEVSPRD